MTKIVLGMAPTRRSIFSAPDAVKYANLTRDKLRELGIHFVDIDDIAEDGLLHDDADRIRIAEKFKAAGVDGLFFPHGNFGTEYEVARLAKELNVPVLLWGPRDERPDENGIRLRDSQCGLFATGKVLRRFRVPFTYLCNCRLDDPEFERGISGGVSYGALGMSHHSAQDIAAMSAIPNMRVYLPSDRFQAATLIKALLEDKKPAYIRVGRNPVEDVYTEGTLSFTLDKAAVFHESGEAAIGISNQRETSLLWDRATGKPLAHAVVWQCARAAAICERKTIQTHAGEIFQRSTIMIFSPLTVGLRAVSIPLPRS